MGITNKLVNAVIAVTKCRCFAHDICFKHIRDSLESRGIEWEEELLSNREKGDIVNILFSKMDQVFFHPDRFEILVDARGFRPEEIKCSVTNKTVEINAQKEDKFEHAHQRMSLTRQYQLPHNAAAERGQCCLSSDGMLLITAPWLK